MGLEKFLKSATGGFASGIVDTGFGLVRDALGRSHANSMLKKQQEFTEKMARNKHSYEVESMLKAGLNPAMSHGTAQLATAPSTPSTPSSGQGSVKQARQLYQEEMDVLDAQKREKEAVITNELAQAREHNALATLYETDAPTRNRDNMARIILNEFSANLTSEERNVIIAKHNLINEFKNAGGVNTYINNMTSQAGWYDSDSAYKDKITSLASYEAESRRISANSMAKQAEVQDFLKDSLKEVYKSQARNYEQVTEKEKKLVSYYGALMAKADTEKALLKIKEEAYKKLGGSDYAAAVMLMDDIMRNGERGAKIANYITSAFSNVVNSGANVIDAVVPF